MAEKNTIGVLDGAILAYAKVAEPTKQYQSEDLEYCVDCIVEKPVAKAWNKQFPKQKAKEIDAAEFVERYKMDNPFPDEDEVYIIKLKKPATKDGRPYEERYRPKVLLDTSTGERVDITNSRLIANGSVAKVSYRVTSNSFGTFGNLQNILMTEEGFKEYVSTGNTAGSEFDDKPISRTEDANEFVTNARKRKQEAAIENPDHPDDAPVKKPVAKAEKPKKKADLSDMDDDIPF